MRKLGTSIAIIAAASLLATACGKKDEKKEPEKQPEKQPDKPAVTAPAPDTLPKFPEPTIPDDNPQTPEKIALGHMLFFDKRLSVDGSRSCYSCHQNEHGNGGETPLAVGAKDKQLTRHSPVIWNVAFLPGLYWDGRADSLEAQAKGAWGGGNMGVGADNLDKKAAEIGKLYADQFKTVFPDEGATADTVAKAIAAYERTLICNDTAYDKYAAGDESALNDQQKQGLSLFLGKAQCTVCHAPPMFSNAMSSPSGMYVNIGIGTKDVPEDQVDVGRMKVSEKPEDWAAFKVPSLRNVGKSAPYFHNGSVAELEDAVKLMAGGGIDNKNKSKLLMKHDLTDDEIAAIVAFLGALDCGELEQPELPE